MVDFRNEFSDFKNLIWASSTNDKYSEKNIFYDLNGNILRLTRNGLLSPNKTTGIIDNLTYYYKGNQLIAVDDAVSTDNGGDFVDNGQYYSAPAHTVEYTYDKNGNLTADKNKGIVSIAYNYLNLPVSIAKTGFMRLEYLYDGAGAKRQQKQYTTSQSTPAKTTDFICNFVYENNVPAYNTYDEGRIVYSPNIYFAEVYLKDHLGNTRVACRLESGVLKTRQVNSYYPFGMNIKGLSVNSSDTYKPNEYLYNGKMMQDEMSLGWLDYGARMYDATLGRFHTIDRYAEKYVNFTPYHYALNNPIIFVDRNGDSVNVADLYSKNDKGMYNHPLEILAFELFASTKEGGQNVLDYAQTGFSLKGAYVKDLNLSTDKSGNLNDQGIDVNVSAKDISNGVANTHDNWKNPETGVASNVRPDRLKISIGINPIDFSSGADFHFNMLYSVDGVSHEFGLHADLLSKNYNNSNFNINPYSHLSASVSASRYLNGYDVNAANTNAIRILNAVQNRPIMLNYGQSKDSPQKLWEKYILPGLGTYQKQ